MQRSNPTELLLFVKSSVVISDTYAYILSWNIRLVSNSSLTY